MGFTFDFLRMFGLAVWVAAPLLLLFLVAIVVLGLIVGRLEKWSRFDAIYWSFVTATTVGFGDIRPLRPAARVLAIVIALNGILLTGILVTLAVQAGSIAFSNSGAIEQLRTELKSAVP